MSLEMAPIREALGDVKQEAGAEGNWQAAAVELGTDIQKAFPNKRHSPCFYQNGGKPVVAARAKSEDF